MNLKRILAAFSLALMANIAIAQNTFRIHESFVGGETFDAIVTFSSNYESILSVSGKLDSAFGLKQVSGVSNDSITIYSPTRRGMSLIGPDGFPDGYLLDLTWDFTNSSNITLPNFLIPGSSEDNPFYSNSINGWNYATDASISAVPEPASVLMLVTGLITIAGIRNRRRRNQVFSPTPQ